MFFLTGSAVLNIPQSFETGFSFSYSAINEPGIINVYDGLNAAGDLVTSLNLPVTPSDGGDPSGSFSPFFNLGVGFQGKAYSIDFGGTVNQIAFDDITIGSATPGTNANIPFQVGDIVTNPIYASKLSSHIFVDGDGPHFSFQEGFDRNIPTYIITHGWQNNADHIDPDFIFDGDNWSMPLTQQQIQLAILGRLSNEETSALKANIITFEWEGAYTGGLGDDSESLINAAKEARINADYAGVLLGRALEDKLKEDYKQDIHFIGHSYGTVVNGLATRYLESTGTLDKADTIQFTVLDAPTDFSSSIGAPKLNKDWFVNNLSPKVNYVDNYYGSTFEKAFGQPIDGAGLNQQVSYDHSGVAGTFYPDLIRNGPNANTNPDGIGTNFPHGFKDWITPILSTYDERTGNDFVSSTEGQRIKTISESFEAALGTPFIATSLPGYDSFAFNGLFLKEQSPVSAYYDLGIPLDAEWLSFDWMVDVGGDGDWFTVHFGADLLWSMGIDSLFEGTLLNAMVDVSDYAGMSGDFYFTLNSVGDSNAAFYVGNFAFRGTSSVPEPSVLMLVSIGILVIAFIRFNRVLMNQYLLKRMKSLQFSGLLRLNV
ncbi:PEP-CTERM protein-sorting domain-containing protein [Nitrosomonas marina]|uniref:PEP-CTERM protein-sorting domain-containing protein n=1 Tax=Nitrosomonas marina TaxID=917 RepID=A0A1H9Z020_9PROT|nr:hypothetical protein [Nitrosomonas marina]SES74765.1 PEP-CTERM protein-sorting domain-containing protein [Nitrosomonas marina]